MQWAVEKMKINPICFSDKLKREYYLKGPMGTAGRVRSIMTGNHISIFSFSRYETGAYTKLQETDNVCDDISLIKNELIYRFMDNPEVFKYLVKCGGGQEIINKQLDYKMRKEYILRDIYQDIFVMSFCVFIIISFFLNINLLSLALGLLLGNGLIVLVKNSNFNHVKHKFEEMKKYLLGLKAV